MDLYGLSSSPVSVMFAEGHHFPTKVCRVSFAEPVDSYQHGNEYRNCSRAAVDSACRYRFVTPEPPVWQLSPLPVCGHEICRKICTSHSSRDFVTRRTPENSHVAVLLFTTLEQHPAVLLTRGDAEIEYGMTGGVRKMDVQSGICYRQAIAHTLAKDIHIPLYFVERYVQVRTFRRLKNGTPVVIAYMNEHSMNEILAHSTFACKSQINLFRIDNTPAWRVPGSTIRFAVSSSVRSVVAQIEADRL